MSRKSFGIWEAGMQLLQEVFEFVSRECTEQVYLELFLVIPFHLQEACLRKRVKRPLSQAHAEINSRRQYSQTNVPFWFTTFVRLQTWKYSQL